MAKAGMRRPSPKEPHGTESNYITHIPKNDMPPVPEHQGKVKSGKKKASTEQILSGNIDKPISKAHKDYDTDLARDNLENDHTAADLQDL